MMGSRAEPLSELLGGIGQISEAAGRPASASTQVASNSTRLSNSSSTMAATVEQLTASINHVADNASHLRNLSQRAGSSARDGGSVIEKLIKAMNTIADQVRLTDGTVQELDSSSQQISSVVQVIREVAEQTNLLALNAAIEAARAGETGRGFAVVADEVRKLAERTRMSTQEISARIDAIRGSVNGASNSMGRTVKLAEEGVHAATTADSSIQAIITNASEVEQEIDIIDSALNEQSGASNQIAQNVEQIARSTAENCRGADETADLARGLAALAETMRTAASRYRLQ